MKSGEKDKSRKRLSLGAPLKTKNSSTKENEPPAIFMEANDDEAGQFHFLSLRKHSHLNVALNCIRGYCMCACDEF